MKKNIVLQKIKDNDKQLTTIFYNEKRLLGCGKVADDKDCFEYYLKTVIKQNAFPTIFCNVSS